MVDNIISTPLIVTVILGVVGLAIPVIDAFKKERGSNNRLYSGIAFSALILTIGIVIFRILSGEVMPAVLFTKGVLSDDLFGSFFAVALLIVSIMVTASSWDYMKDRSNPATYYSLILLSSIGMAIHTMANLSKDLVPIGLLSIALFIAGFGFKMGLVPFHMWLPDAYEGSPTTIGALLAAGTKKAGFAAALRVIVLGMFALNLDWTLTLAIVAVFTMTLGNLGALIQKSVPRILAYSSIAQAGYILIGFAIAPYSNQALTGSLFHILNHAVMKSAGFIAAAAVATALASYSLERYKGLGRRMPITAIAFSISLLALAGVPPLNGFWSKLVLFGAAIDSGPIVEWGPWLAIAGVLNSALSLGYYAWIMRKMYMEDAPDMSRVKEPRAIVAVLVFAIVFMVGFGIWHAPLLDFASKAVPQLASNITHVSTVIGGSS